MKRNLKSLLSILLVLAITLNLCSCNNTPNSNNNKSNVSLGIDNIDDYLHLFKDKRVGLITNASGVNSNFEGTIDVLNSKVNLVALFSPEHGIRGAADAGESVSSDVDEKTGITVHSLYGNTKKPTTEMLEDLDVLVYDIQDVGARFYTYISTLNYVMKASKENSKEVVVLDRPNPINGVSIQGAMMSEDYTSFVGITKTPQRYGLTVGEVANFMNTEDDINCNLNVVKMNNWNRNTYYDQTGLKSWVMPSPNIPTVDSALVFSGTCLIEGTNISEGRGTTKPFELIGAPFINAQNLADNLNSLNLNGVYFRATSFTPTSSKFKDTPCNGIEIHVIDRNSFNSAKTGISILYTIKDMYPNDFKFLETNTIDILSGDDDIRSGNLTLNEMLLKFDNDSSEFSKFASKYHLYK